MEIGEERRAECRADRARSIIREASTFYYRTFKASLSNIVFAVQDGMPTISPSASLAASHSPFQLSSSHAASSISPSVRSSLRHSLDKWARSFQRNVVISILLRDDTFFTEIIDFIKSFESIVSLGNLVLKANRRSFAFSIIYTSNIKYPLAMKFPLR